MGIVAAELLCAATSPDRLFCHVYGRARGQAQMIPGWPYSVIAALEPGRTSWTPRCWTWCGWGPDDDQAAVTAAQVRDVVTRLIEAGHWRNGDPAIQARATATPPRVTTWGKPPEGNAASRHSANAQVKKQAESVPAKGRALRSPRAQARAS